MVKGLPESFYDTSHLKSRSLDLDLKPAVSLGLNDSVRRWVDSLSLELPLASIVSLDSRPRV